MADLDPVRVARVTGALAAGEPDPARSLCVASAAVLGVAGAGVVLMSRGHALGSVCVSDARTEAVEDMQYALGEGPCVDAFRSLSPVLVPDLARVDDVRWTAFRVGALEAGMHAAFGFPLLVGSICIGALDLYHDKVGELTDEQIADAEVVAYIATRTVLGWQAVAEKNSLAWQLEDVPLHRAVVHQAAGMVSVQASVSVDDALTLIRAYAFSEGNALGMVATDVVEGRLRLDG
jgi:hypothetical protein